MTRFTSHTTAFLAALFITLASVNAIVTVPPVQAATVTAPALA